MANSDTPPARTRAAKPRKSHRGSSKDHVKDSAWHVYILRCADGSLYTGITTDLTRRLHEHNTTTRGARFTRGRRPVELIYSASLPSRSMASQRESGIKQLTRAAKERLIAGEAG
ncbi:MAG: GIY-YIG nuclease family protein [Granulosicoccus sp.]